ncbi:RluA family pseudouridine synthase [bacterium]|nr:RluA family pseudouridine synthase [bacterium]
MINTKKKFICPKDKVRLDKFLVEKLVDLSRSKIQRLVVDGKAKVNSTIIKKKHHWLSAGDKVEISQPPLSSKHFPLLSGKKLMEMEKTIRIIKATDNYLVLEKPAGLIVHPAENVQEYTLVDYLIKKYPQIKTVGDNPEFRPGIVHRLDKKVSGLMVVALNQKIFSHLKSQFKNRSIVKKYLALVHGKMTDHEGEIDFPIARSKRSGKMVAKGGNLEAKEALTLWEVKQSFSHYTLLNIQIKTGRTHQIRAHLKAISHPVAGDDLYNIKGCKDKFDLNRIFLHAYHLEFIDLDGEVQVFEIELPEKLKDVIKGL